VDTLIKFCEEKQIPIIHANSKKRLGMAFTGRKGPKLSIISLVDYEG
jgi:ribosomal protein L7Ae-like RNA K-turn-binding protein